MYLRIKFKYKMSSANIIDYSIIICTYNPDKVIFQRCLKAVASLNTGNFRTEIILVDNNSNISLSEEEYVKSFIRDAPNSRMITVVEQGLSHARVGGILESKGEQIVFFDDDNEPEANYLAELHFLNKNYPTVAAWGPGTIDIDFISNVDDSLEDIAKQAFQDRHEKTILYSNQHSWQNCYPFGTGLAIRRQYCVGYIEGVIAGIFTLSGRKKNELSSGEDTQMVLYLTSKGAAAGVAPTLSITHMVPAKRTTFEYLKRLTYGTSVCFSTCMIEVYPDYVDTINRQLISPRKFNRKVLKKMFGLFFTKKAHKSFALIEYLGMVSGDYIALKKPVPALAKWSLRRLGVV
jgi:glycosyltransferase involved in cell wall biosynthesis